MQLYLRFTAFVFLLVLTDLTLHAQTFSSYDTPGISEGSQKATHNGSIAGTWEAGAMLGPDFYYGDLNSKKFLPDHSVSAAGGVYCTRQFTNAIGLKAQLLFGGLHGSKSWQKGSVPVFSAFNGIFLDFTINSVFNFSNILSPYHSGRKVFVYGTVGLGLNAWNTSLTNDSNGVRTNAPQTGGFQSALVLPVGLGLQYAVSGNISVGIEYTVRTVFSDYLDQTPGGFNQDFVNLLAFTASYRFGVSKSKLNVQEYGYISPARYQAVVHQTVPAAAFPTSAIPASPEAIAPPQASETYEYVVQVCAYSRHNYSTDWVKKHYRISLPVTKESEDGINRYIISTHYKEMAEARELCDRLRKQGIRDAWVIAYQNGRRHHVVIY